MKNKQTHFCVFCQKESVGIELYQDDDVIAMECDVCGAICKRDKRRGKTIMDYPQASAPETDDPATGLFEPQQLPNF